MPDADRGFMRQARVSRGVIGQTLHLLHLLPLAHPPQQRNARGDRGQMRPRGRARFECTRPRHLFLCNTCLPKCNLSFWRCICIFKTRTTISIQVCTGTPEFALTRNLSNSGLSIFYQGFEIESLRASLLGLGLHDHARTQKRTKAHKQVQSHPQSNPNQSNRIKPEPNPTPTQPQPDLTQPRTRRKAKPSQSNPTQARRTMTRKHWLESIIMSAEVNQPTS